MGNAALSGPLTVAGGFVGNVTGNVVGNVTGNVTGNITGVVVDNAKVTTTAANAAITLTQPVETINASNAAAQTITVEPSVGKIVTIVQTAAGTNAHTFLCNGGTWDGTNKDCVINAPNTAVTFAFITATKALVLGQSGANVAYDNT